MMLNNKQKKKLNRRFETIEHELLRRKRRAFYLGLLMALAGITWDVWAVIFQVQHNPGVGYLQGLVIVWGVAEMVKAWL